MGDVRHTHSTAAGIEDTIAILLDIKIQLEVQVLRVNHALDILRQVRESPHGYDQERRNLKIEIRHKK